jgi:TIR domain
MSTPAFPYDVFLSHSAKDKEVVRPLAERLWQDGLKVWPVPPERPCEGGFDVWVLKAGDSIPAKIEEGLEHSRALACPAVASSRSRMLCMSANEVGSDWAQLEAGTFRFRDPLNKDRRFIPLRLEEAIHR